MSNTNTNFQTQTSNALHNAIMEAGGKDRPPMLAPGNYVQWKSRIERYIDTKPNNKHIHYCLQNPPYKFKWTEKTILVVEGSSETTTEGIDNDIYSTVDAYPNACEMWKAIKRFYKTMNELVINKFDVTNHQVNVQFLLQLQPEWQRSQPTATRNRGKTIVNSPPPTYDQEPTMVAKDGQMLKEKEINKLMALISLSFKKIYKPTNNNLRTSSNTIRANHSNTPRINRGTGKGMLETETGKGCSLSQGENTIIQEVTPDAANNSGPIFDAEPLQRVQNNNDNYNMFVNDREHLEQLESVNDTYLEEQGDTNITIGSLDMSTNGETVD
ncbi:hypothetical protein Tco_1184753 [Tanacetum coccineum]